MKKAIKFNLLTTTALSVALLGAAQAHAAETPAPTNEPAVDEVEAIVVTGFRESLLKASDIKRRAVGSQDVIVADDIAAFPDLNLAESLQRISGVTISRDAGEGRQIALRGLGPDFTRTQLNGMEVLTNTASGMDNRGSVSRSRSFDYSIFASELFNKVVVEKSYAAEQDEGGIGGTVGLFTAKPFDYAGFKAVASIKAMNNANTDTTTPRVVGLISNRWGDFGALFSVAYGQNDINEYGYRNWNWTLINAGAANVGPGVSAADRDRLVNATGNNRVRASQAQTYSTWFNKRERLGLTTALQYHPGERLTMDLDLMYGTLTNDRDEFQMTSAGVNALTGNITGTQRLNSVVIQGNSLVAADVSGVDMRSEHKFSHDKTTFTQAVFNGGYQVSDAFKIKALLGYSKSEFEEPIFDKVFLQSTNKSIAYDFRGGRMGKNTYNFDLTDPAQWGLMRADTREDYISSEYKTAKLDGVYDFGGGSILKAGVEYRNFANNGFQRYQRIDWYNKPVVPQAVKYVVNEKSVIPYIVADIDGTYASTGQLRDLTTANDQPGSNYQLEEKTTSAFVQYDLDATAWNYPVRANVGVRYYSTDLTSAGTATQGSVLLPVVIKSSYDGFLPTLNLAVDVRENLVARFSANRNISRPSLSDLRAAGSVSFTPFGGTISAGNPNLKPFLADSVEGSLEFYQGKSGYIALSAFYKNMDSFITSETSLVPYGSTGYPTQFQGPGQDGSTMYSFNRPVNGDGATIKGVELAFQRDFDFLPAPFDKFGFVGNVTYATGKSNVLIDGASYSLDLMQLSKWTSNATLYYETDKWGARISSAYRDGYLDGAGGNGNIGSGYHSTNNIDFAAHYNAPNGLKLVVEGINLTNQAIDQYTDIAADRVLAYTKSGRTFTFGVTYEF
ncbi:TonB-dependent receptor [Caulobacter endophyticus]|uniref:TonB-dependent receptor n=1 Tax=Caulobacter endophyticus TaxID=2172652 RepID=UPI00240F70F1|nr:TonB-dependent receptor [Caulobacter endophyticus]MDG2527227.1 TonB-dependent receptor [Caulobacter endophyticus]